jgi:AcrR family transcriptional regulator
MSMSSSNSHPGRPRDPNLDKALFEAAKEVFFERGYQAASLAEIGRRAGVGTPAIYRRWATKAALAIDLVEIVNEPRPIPDSGSIRKDLIQFLRLRLRVWSTPMFQQVLFPVAAEAMSNPTLAAAVRRRFIDYRESGVYDRIKGAIKAGELRRDTDPGRLLDVLMGTVSMPLLFSQDLPKESQAAAIVDQVLEGFAAKRSSRPRAKR